MPGLLWQQGNSCVLAAVGSAVAFGHALNPQQAAATSSLLSSSRHLSSTPILASEEAGSSSSPAYSLTQEQESIFALAREFAKEKMLPHAAAWEEDKARSSCTKKLLLIPLAAATTQYVHATHTSVAAKPTASWGPPRAPTCRCCRCFLWMCCVRRPALAWLGCMFLRSMAVQGWGGWMARSRLRACHTVTSAQLRT